MPLPPKLSPSTRCQVAAVETEVVQTAEAAAGKAVRKIPGPFATDIVGPPGTGAARKLVQVSDSGRLALAIGVVWVRDIGTALESNPDVAGGVGPEADIETAVAAAWEPEMGAAIVVV